MSSTEVVLYGIYPFLALWLFYSTYLCILVYRTPSKVNSFVFRSIPGIFTTLGVLGTFIGITVGLINFDTTNIEDSIIGLLDGMKTAFLSSIIGISFSIIFSWIIKTLLHMRGSEMTVPVSEETRKLTLIHNAISELKDETRMSRDAFIDTNSNSTKKMLEEIKNTNKELVAMGEQSNI